MFKGKKKSEPKREVPPEIAGLDLRASTEAARGRLIESLAKESRMWRGFVQECEAGRHVWESHIRYYLGAERMPVSLDVQMDEISAPLWKAFAEQMAGVAEKRLREILG